MCSPEEVCHRPGLRLEALIISLNEGLRFLHFWKTLLDGLAIPIPPLDALELLDDVLRKTVFHDARRIADNYGIGRHIFCDDGSGTDDRAIADVHAAEDERVTPDPDIVADDDLIVIVVISVSSIAIPSRLLNFEILKRSVPFHDG